MLNRKSDKNLQKSEVLNREKVSSQTRIFDVSKVKSEIYVILTLLPCAIRNQYFDKSCTVESGCTRGLKLYIIYRVYHGYKLKKAENPESLFDHNLYFCL